MLLPGIGANGKPSDSGIRYVLGPSEMTGHSIGSPPPSWTRPHRRQLHVGRLAGSTLWDSVADANFHQYLGIELDGVVYSAPIIQPQQAAFSSFAGNGQISAAT